MITVLFFAINGFAGEKKKETVKKELDEKSKLEFDYSFMEGVRSKITGDFQGAMGWYDNCLKIDPESPVVKYEIANLLLGTDDYNGALQLAREAVAGNPSNLWYKLLLANVLQKKSMIEEACNVYADIIAKYPDKEEFYLIESGLYTSVEKWQKAIDVYDRYEKQNGITEPVSIEKIRLYSKLNNVKGASDELLKLINKFPEKNEYLSLLAELYFNYDQDKKGLQILNKLLKVDPQNGYVHLYLADYYRGKNKLSEADKHVKEALVSDELKNSFKVQYMLTLILSGDTVKITDTDLNSYMDILMSKYSEDLSIRALHSDFLRKDGKLQEAREELDYILDKEKNNYMVWQELLLICNELQDTNCMYSQSVECIKYFPEQPLPYALAGISLMMRKDYGEAVDFFERGVKLADEQVQLRSQFFSYLGDCYYNLDSTEVAFRMFDNVLSINPENALVLNNYAYYLSLLDKDLRKAEDMSSRAVLLEPDNGTYLDTHAWVLFKRKVYSEALYYMKQAMEKTTEPSGVLYEHYGDILYVNGKKEEALAMWLKAKEAGDEVSTDLNAKIAGTYVFN
ncbi:tetratricopeptide repeat protein [Odoribacter lunatus]|uniref:tetratricopeptide repeat protein n=1 Tax=Odoribacter lunatus TaxID=2941335 RepID=UPI00203EB739|nr:tetratricopeptide repeat protein [Odoribacter lunatus]